MVDDEGASEGKQVVVRVACFLLFLLLSRHRLESHCSNQGIYETCRHHEDEAKSHLDLMTWTSHICSSLHRCPRFWFLLQSTDLKNNDDGFSVCVFFLYCSV